MVTKRAPQVDGWIMEVIFLFVERRGRMVRMSDSQPQVVGSNPGEGTAWYIIVSVSKET
jgi:hypothetical protein